MDYPFTEVEELPEFKRDFKKLKKKYRSLNDDLNTFIKTQLHAYHNLDRDVSGIEEISGLGYKKIRIYKATKFACKSLKGSGSRSGIRIIYCHTDENRIELIEIYYKGDKELEDRARIKHNYFEEPE